MKKIRYSLIKINKYVEVESLDYRKLRGFRFMPKNNIEYDGIKVNKMIIVKPSMIEKVLKKKVKRKLDIYLKYIVALLDDDTEDDGGVLELALNDLERYRRTIINKYQLYLDKKYTKLLLKKIELLEHELKTRLLYVRYYAPDEIQEEKSRKSR